MAYERTTWKPDDLVTSGKMNNIEAAIVALNTVDASSDARIEANETAINLINEKIGTNNGAIGTINERIKTNADNIETIDNEIVSLHQEDSNINKRIDGVEDDYKSRDAEFNLELEALKSQGVTGYQGQYNENKIYKLGDMVSYEKTFYVYINSNKSNNQIPVNNTTYWQEVNTALTGSIIEVGENEPENENVKLWINTNETSFEVPTMDDITIARESLRQILNKTAPSFEDIGEIVTITDTVEAPLAGLTIYGDSWASKPQLWDDSNLIILSGEQDGITISGHNGSYVIKGTATAKRQLYADNQNDNLTLFPAGTYTVSTNKELKLQITAFYGSIKEDVNMVLDSKITFTLNNQAKILINIIIPQGIEIDITNGYIMMVNEGATNYTQPFLEYTDPNDTICPFTIYNTQEIKMKMIGKNLLDMSTINDHIGADTVNDVTATFNNGIISFSGTTSQDHTEFIGKEMTIGPGTYTLNRNYINGKDMTLVFYNKNTEDALTSDSETLTFTLNKITRCTAGIILSSADTNMDGIDLKLMLAYNDRWTAFSPYIERYVNIPSPNNYGLLGLITSDGNKATHPYLGGMGYKIADELNFNTGEYIQRCGLFIANGEEDWKKIENKNIYYLLNPFANNNIDIDAYESICNIGARRTYNFLENYSPAENSSENYFAIRKDENDAIQLAIYANCDNLNELKTLLATKNLELVYLLANPIITEIPNNIKQCFNNIYSYEGNTTFMYSSVAAPYIKPKAFINLSAYINNILTNPSNNVIGVTGTTPTINAISGYRYNCDRVSTLNITFPSSGITDITFISGSTPTVLNITPNYIPWANDFDPTSLNANTRYRLNVSDEYGIAMAWPM